MGCDGITNLCEHEQLSEPFLFLFLFEKVILQIILYIYQLTFNPEEINSIGQVKVCSLEVTSLSLTNLKVTKGLYGI
jgi:hypothetical protein